MDEVFVVYVFDATNHLVSQHQYGFHREPPGAKVEQILQGRAKKIHHQHIVIFLLAEPADVGDADATLKDLVELAFVEQLGMAGFVGLQLDSDLFTIGDVDAQVDVAEGSAADLADEPIFSTDVELGLTRAARRRHLELAPGRRGSKEDQSIPFDALIWTVCV